MKIDNNFFIISVLFLLVLIIITHLKKKETVEKFLIKRSSLNDNDYEVQGDLPQPDFAADLLAQLNEKTSLLQECLKNKYINNKNEDITPEDLLAVKRLLFRLETYEIDEAPFEEDSSSYTINKQQISFCLRKKNKHKNFHDLETLNFVLIHELAHVMSESTGHGPEFMRNFRFLLREAHNCGIYNPVNYSINPMTYCGVRVTHNPFYNSV